MIKNELIMTYEKLYIKVKKVFLIYFNLNLQLNYFHNCILLNFHINSILIIFTLQ